MIYYKTKNYLYFLQNNQWLKSDWESVTDAYNFLSTKLQADFIKTEEEFYCYGNQNNPTTNEYTREVSVRIMPEDMTEEMFQNYLQTIIDNKALGSNPAPNPRYITLVSAIKALAKKYKLDVSIKKDAFIIVEFPKFWIEVVFEKHVILKKSNFSNFQNLKFANIKNLCEFVENLIQITK